MMSDFFISLLASLLAALCVPFFIEIWNKIMMPYLENRAYRGHRIHGVWKAEANYNEDGKDKIEREMVDVKQSGYNISGEMVSTLNDEYTVYVFKGEIVNSILTASYWKKGNDDSHDRGTMALKVISDNILKGSFTYYQDTNILTGQYCWRQ